MAAEYTALFKSKIEKFLIRRAAVLFILLAAADLAFLGSDRWPLLAGLAVGALFGACRLGCNHWIYTKVFHTAGGKTLAGSIAAFTAAELFLLPVVAIIYFFSVFALYGFIAGVLTVPAVIMVNSITEAFGITKNNFE